MLNDLFYFSKSDRRAAMALLVIIIISVGARHLLEQHFSPIPPVLTDTLTWNNVQSLPRDSIVYDYRSVARSSTDDGSAFKDDFARPSKVTTTWDVNSPATLCHSEVSDTFSINSKPGYYTGSYSSSGKLAKGAIVDINMADTTLLKRIPGIGSYYARRIVEYRNSLGGFVNTSQLYEIEHLPDIQEWCSVSDTTYTERIMVNTATIQQLRHHPYINFYQARSIVDYRKSHGRIDSQSQLEMLEEFTQHDLDRLRPYLSYE